jgi:hypothetical protein
MRKNFKAIAGGAVCGLLIVGCHQDNGHPSSTPAAPSAAAFESYAGELIQGSTCENINPVATNNIEFSFAADQDTAVPRDVSMIEPTCTSS